MKLQLIPVLALVAVVLRVDAQAPTPGIYTIHNAAWPSQIIGVASAGTEVVGRDEKSNTQWAVAAEDENGSTFTTFRHKLTGQYFGMDESYRFTLGHSKFFWVVSKDGEYYRIHDQPSLKSTWIQSTGSQDEAKLQLALYAGDDKQLWIFKFV